MANNFQPLHCVVESENLELGKDFVVVSMHCMSNDSLDWDEDLEEDYSDGQDFDELELVDKKCGIDSLEYFRSKKIKNGHKQLLKVELEKLGFEYYIHETPFIPNSTFYLPRQPIDLNAAYTFGLGVVQILRGKYKGEFMLYNYEKYDAADLVEEDKHDEQMRLRIYFQYKNPFAYFDKYVYELIDNNVYLADILIVKRKQYMLDFFLTVAAYHREKEEGSIHIDTARMIRGMKL
ncbi:hypothetical protein [Sporosarcina highlanderae]|uniref:Uncharacterized protein n=1 Tax=Sporosarcina highlanderae TaxID=3035916 RepID=A0ABT8JT01_9BACL|nr:hypothetical protein [Sporosarcina highlanderae]MDN4608209.1 hypothetical protein [Sporosarcina highlanderae]